MEICPKMAYNAVKNILRRDIMEKRDVKSTVINSILILLAVLLFLFFSSPYF